MEHTKVGENESLGHHFVSVVEDDYHKLKPTIFGVDLESIQKRFDTIQEAIGDVLPVRMGMDCLYSVPTQRDVYTINKDISKAHRYVSIIREEIAKHWNA